MTKPVTVGFIGLGHNGVAHLETHLRLGLSQPIALCDCNLERLHEVSGRFQITRVFTEAESLCASPELEAVSISTGDPFHEEAFVAAVRHGKHVMVEKPLGNSVAQVESMVSAARAAAPELKLAVAYVLRTNPVFMAIHEQCRSGRLGEIYYLEADYVHNLLYQARQTDPRTGRNWYLEDELPMVGGGSHALDLLRWFAGAEVIEVVGCANHVAFPAMQSDDCQVALFRFASGAIGKVAALYAPRCPMAPYYNLRVYGTHGTVERDTIALAKDADDVHPEFTPVAAERVAGHGYDAEIAAWLRAIRGEGQPCCDLYDGANSTVATLKAVEAMEEGGTVVVPVYRRR